MSKSKLLAAMLFTVGLVTGAVAQSSVTVYGTVDASMQGAKASGQEATKQHSRVESNGSLLGFRGAEDLGQGNKAVFQIETAVNLNGNSNGTTSVNNGTAFGTMRDSYVGLSSKSGTVVLGYLSTPYKSVVDGLDVFHEGDNRNTSLLGRTKAGTADVTSAFRTTAIAYVLPQNSANIVGSIAVTGNGSNQNTAQRNGAGEGVSASLGWNGNGFGVISAYQQTKFVSDTLTYDRLRSTLLGATYTGVPGLKVVAAANRNDIRDVAGDSVHQNSYFVGTSYLIGKWEPRASFVKAADISGTTGTGAKQWNAGVGYHLSKRTEAYALYSRIDNGTLASYDFVNAPVATTTALTADAAVQTIGVGLRHSF